MLKLKKLIESYGAAGQYYDLGKDFANFRRMVDGATQQIRLQYEKIISSRLAGKRVRARSSRGYKQYVKDYEFDIVRISIDDYYGNYVVVAHDSTTPKPKEYFLRTDFKIQILGPATGEPSPQKVNKPETPTKHPVHPVADTQDQSMELAPAGNTPAETPINEEPDPPLRDGYSIDLSISDIEPWIPNILKKSQSSMRDFVKELGWKKKIDEKTDVILFEILIPFELIKPGITVSVIEDLLSKQNKENIKYSLVESIPDKSKEELKLRIKKTIFNEI